MSRLAACPKCRNQFTLPELAGPATIACPFCQAHITIKVKAAVPPPAMVVQPAMAVARAMPVDDEDDEEDEEEDPRPRKKKKKKKGVSSASNETGMKIAIVGGILLMTLLAIVFAFWWFMRGDGKPKVIMPSELQQSKNGMRMQPEDDGEAYAEASGNEKFELAERLITNKDLYQSFVPTIILPGLQTTRLDDRLESLPSDVLNRVKNATVYIETERDDGGGTES
ncbi:MAG TPA: hypothetical protein PKA06_15145, partial [Gemmatales bacterium]|nr:hypothetical protein [Gemmatales bacterium]